MRLGEGKMCKILIQSLHLEDQGYHGYRGRRPSAKAWQTGHAIRRAAKHVQQKYDVCAHGGPQLFGYLGPVRPTELQQTGRTDRREAKHY